MKVLHITTIDTGGAYKAVSRLHESMMNQGIASKVIVRTKLHDDSRVTEVNAGFWKKNISRGKNVINQMFKKGEMHGDRFGTDLSHNKYVQEADIIILHWINSFLSLSNIAALCELGKPVIWVLHDMWIFTGGCHCDRYCGRYEQFCGYCPLLSSSRLKDITYYNYCRKLKVFQNVSMTVVGPSRWITDCAGKSQILQQKRILRIPNTLNTKLYMPLHNKVKLRQKYHILSDKKLILFGASGQGTEDLMKGFSYLLKAIQQLSAQEYALAVFGNTGKNITALKEFDIYELGYIEDEKELCEIYNLADVFVNPSLQESFGFTVCEAMACGVPVTAFAIGGIKDQVTHRENGYLAEYQNADDLASGIVYCAQHSAELGEKAHVSAQKYSYENIGRKYQKICDDLLMSG